MSLVLEILKGIGLFIIAGALAILVPVVVFLPLAWAYEKLTGKRRSGGTKPGPSDFPRIKARMTRLARPTLLLTPAREPGFSKLGGDPELPSGWEWPAGSGRPRTFLAQVDFAAFQPHARIEWLPEEGKIYAFLDDHDWANPELVRVVYSTEAADAPRPPPPGVKQRFPERRVAFESYTSIPSLDWFGIDVCEIHVTEEELDDLAGAPDLPFGDELQHRIGGYPSEIQEEQMALTCERIRRGLPPYDDVEPSPAIERASKQWRLLLQIDSDPALKMNWGDGGRLYVFVREKDALTGDFSKTVTIWQTY